MFSIDILVASIVFTAIIVLLVASVLTAHRWLSPSGAVAIDINHRKTCVGSAGTKLLWALSDQAIYLPAACGGRGTCGQCRVVVNGDVRPLLSTEAVHISHRAAARGERLACMLTLVDDLSITVAEDLLEARRWTCTVESNRNLTPFIKELRLRLPDHASIGFDAGDYVLLEAGPGRVRFEDLPLDARSREIWARHNLLQLSCDARQKVVRAYSIASAPQEPDRLTLVVRIALPPASAAVGTPPGLASSLIFALRAGDQVPISGPFGDFHASNDQQEMVLIAGGVGIAPIRSIILDQLSKGTERKLGLWYGVRKLNELCYAEEFAGLVQRHDNFEFHRAVSEPQEATEGSVSKGLIHSVLYDDYLRHHQSPESLEYYLCGPPLMTTAVIQMLEDLGVDSDSIYFDDFGA
jgi:Na+-transporting NADH:ubiquinone oxidoreductase subunit F